MFSVHTTSEGFENSTITGHFGFVFEENSVRELNHIIIVTPSFSKSSFFKMFPSAGKRKPSVLKFLRFKEGFPKGTFKKTFKNVFRPHENAKPVSSNSSSLKSVFEKLRFRDGLVCT